MERMEKPLWSCVDELIDGSGASKTVDLSALAQRFIQIVQEVHAKKHVLVDIKPDNFMFAKGTKKSQTHADLLRTVDLGLWTIMPKDPEPVASLTGNDLYCSLHMQKMIKSTFRDDIQGILIVIAELAIRVHAALLNQTDDYEKSEIPSFLPWSQGKNQTEVFRLKEENLLKRKSEFYKRMPADCAETIFKLIQTTQKLEFHSMPPYATLMEELAKFAVKKPAKRKARTSTATTARAKAGAKTPPRSPMPAARTTRSSAKKVHNRDEDEGSDLDTKPAARRRRTTKRQESSDDNMEIDLTYSEGDDSVEPMDIDYDEAEQENRRLQKPDPQQTLVIKVKKGKKEIDSFVAVPDSIFVFGSGPSNRMKKENTHVQIPAGEGVHCSLFVVGLKRPGSTQHHAIVKVEIQHMAKTGSTKVGSKTLGPSEKTTVPLQEIYKSQVGKNCKVWIGDVLVTFERNV